MADDLLVARGLVVAYGRPAAMFARRSVAPAVLYGIDIHVGKGETVGIVGESGSGKTTLGRALLGLVKPVAGSVIAMQITTIGLDIAKNVFQVHGIDAAVKVVVRKQLRRGQMMKFFAALPPCLIGMEACASAHYWARELTKLGHEVRLMPAKDVKAYVK